MIFGREGVALYPVPAERWESKENWGVKVLYRVSELCDELDSDLQLVRKGQDWLHERAIWSRLERLREDTRKRAASP